MKPAPPPKKRTFGDVEKDLVVLTYANSIGALQVLCPCAKRKERRDETEPLDDESLEDSDNNTLGLSAQDLRDPAAIVSLRSHPCLAGVMNAEAGYGSVFCMLFCR